MDVVFYLTIGFLNFWLRTLTHVKNTEITLLYFYVEKVQFL